MMWGYGGGWPWVMAFTMIAGLLLLALAVALLFAIVVRGRASSGPSGYDTATDAERELEMRFARGEIDADALARGRAALRRG